MNKEKYERLEIEVMVFNSEDIITTSSDHPGGDDWETPVVP